MTDDAHITITVPGDTIDTLADRIAHHLVARIADDIRYIGLDPVERRFFEQLDGRGGSQNGAVQ